MLIIDSSYQLSCGAYQVRALTEERRINTLKSLYPVDNSTTKSEITHKLVLHESKPLDHVTPISYIIDSSFIALNLGNASVV